MDVGIRELKSRLSEYIDRAAKGELIRVTERGQPKAVLGPLPGRVRLEEGIRAGWIRPGKDAPAVTVERFVAGSRTEDVLAEDRQA
ncbi:MAG TPA: type II toxin-antitoxin system prevent-host-death family antitoxin [Polyangiaceae bacterium]|jgi:prevent-host-death family protein